MLKATTVHTVGEEEGVHSIIFPILVNLNPDEQRPKRPKQQEVTQHWEAEPFIDVRRLIAAEESFASGDLRWLYPFAAMNLLVQPSGWFKRRIGPRTAVLQWMEKREWKLARDRSRLLALAEARYGPVASIPE